MDDLEVAQQLAKTCYELYRRVPTGLAPEIAVFNPPGVPWPKEHSADVGGDDFHVNAQVCTHCKLVLNFGDLVFEPWEVRLCGDVPEICK